MWKASEISIVMWERKKTSWNPICSVGLVVWIPDIRVTSVQNGGFHLGEKTIRCGAIITRPRGPSGLSKPARLYINAIYTYNFDVDWLLLLLRRIKANVLYICASMRDLRLDEHSVALFIRFNFYIMLIKAF